MSNLNYYQTIYQRISRKTPESTVSIWGIRQPKLRQYLVQSLSEVGSHSGLLADPVFESTYAWESAQPKMLDLAGNLLQPSLVDAMDQAPKERFGKDWHPHKHQLKSWKAVLEDQKSIVVTSGTGSGKTECFMVPILNDLVSEAEQTKQNLEGVRALFLYPLNALINSQRNRLRAWTQSYNKQVRFCLYNGETPESIKKEKKSEVGQNPNEVFDRATLRLSPPPILVTNATMLEYMLVRHNDAPIIENSEGKLRWIVLDEAHTYIGSQAAELSLLLKRVMLAFKVKPKDVRFVATSATIGDDEQAQRQLATFLSSLAGIDEQQVKVIGGQRIVPDLPKSQAKNYSIEELETIEPDQKKSVQRYQALTQSNIALKLREILHPKNKAKTLSEINHALWNDANKKLETLRWIDVCSATSNDDQSATPFLPLRGHFFHQTTDRLWACVDKDCSCKAHDDLGEDWKYGMVYTYQRQSCECGAPVFEVVFCQDCATPYLLAKEDLNSREVKQSELERIDEFSLIEETSYDDEESDIERAIEQSTEHQPILLCGQEYVSKTIPEDIGFDRSFIHKPDIKSVQTHSYSTPQSRDIKTCPSCEYSARKGSFYRRTFLGAPFFIANTMPILLDACSTDEKQALSDLPYDGRKLITFSDSRQGTARIAVKIQQESERAVLRTQITDETNKLVQLPQISDKEEAEYSALSQRLKTESDAFVKSAIEKRLAELSGDMSGELKITALSWHDAVSAILANNQDIKTRILDAYRRLDPQLFNESLGEKNIAELLLLKEFARRPKNQNSLETLGLVSMQYPAINALKDLPEAVKRLGFEVTLQDWKALLKLILDFYFRENTIANISDSQTKWMGAKIFAKKVYPFDYDGELGKRRMFFPKAKEKGRQNRIVRVLATAFEEKNLDFKHSLHLDWINSILKAAWEDLLSASHERKNARYKLLTGDKTEGFQLNMEAIAFSANAEVWACPYTNRLIDSTFKGISPYLPNGASKVEATCDQIKMPQSVLQMDTKDKFDNLSILNIDSDIKELRDRNLWTDMSDRVFEYSRFIRSEEHSAQQPAKKLKQYEGLFEQGKINVLNCSTTMEMGVDIGGISVVEMNNVPPHPANYLQRAGRAGRRKETQSLAYTMCKNNTHEKTVFRNPKWAFETQIKAPYIKLDSDKIVQRHINSYLLAFFLKTKVRDQEKQATSLTCHWFYTHLADGKEPYIRFKLWLDGLVINRDDEIDNAVIKIKHLSSLVSTSNQSLIEKTISQLEKIAEKWKSSFNKIFAEFNQLTDNQKNEPYGKKLSFDLKTFEKEYLLSHLATSAFLPGYGFPTGLVSFDQMTISDFKRQKETSDNEREDRYSRRRERPTRNLAIAIREYAPGAQVVLDGLVYQSEGVLLNVNEPESGFTEPQRFEAAWRCNHCGQIGYEKTYQSKICCTNCGHDINPRDIQEYLTPEAFSVGFYGEPTNDVSSQTYMPVENEWVSADTSPQTLFNPNLGTYRVSDQGNIFYHSRGQHQNGYAVCLRCGRSESMTEQGELPKVFADSGHKRLRGIGGQDSWCEGTIENYAVKSNVAFGGTLQTDVFELYLKHPETGHYLSPKKDEKLAWTLAITLREALAELHGIDASEMGFLVKPIDLEDGKGKASAIVLYDVNGGGSGFASTGYKYLEDMFKKSIEQLHCPVHCETACQSCLIDFETRHHEEKLDRKVALAYIEKILPYLSLSKEDQILGAGSGYCHDPLDSELLYLGYKGDSELVIYLGGMPSDWSIAESRLKGRLQAFQSQYNKVTLVLPEIDFSELSLENQQDLYFLHLSDIILVTGTAHQDTAYLLADVVKDNNIQRFASNKPVNCPNESFWSFSDAICVKAEVNQALVFNEFDVTHFSGKVNDTVKDIEINQELDGSLAEFGDRFWMHIIQSSDSFLKTFQTKKLSKVTYEDKYINSPWIVLIIHNVFDALRTAMGYRWSVDSIELNSSEIFTLPKGGLIARDFESSDEKEGFIQEYLSNLANEIIVNLEDGRTMQHARILTLNWEDGTQTRIRLDHGFGNWKWDGYINERIDGSIGWLDQLSVVACIEEQQSLKIKNNDQHAAYIVVSHLN